MPVTELLDISSINLESIVVDRDQIYALLPHRHEMSLLDGIVHFDPGAGFAVAFHDVRDDEFWVRGHIPGRPLMPGILMVEAAGQLCGYYFDVVQKCGGKHFFGFAGLTDVRFRGTVLPGQRLIIVCSPKKMRSLSAVFLTQAYVDGRIVYEGTIKGMVIPAQ